MDYKKEIMAMVRKHQLGFLFNPGGGAFNHPDYGQCQISTIVDKDDYEKLMAWLKGKERKTSITSEKEWIDIFHNKEYYGEPCNKLAFRYRGSFDPDTVLSADNIQWPDGTMAEPTEVFHCGSCGMELSAASLTEDGVG